MSAIAIPRKKPIKSESQSGTRSRAIGNRDTKCAGGYARPESCPTNPERKREALLATDTLPARKPRDGLAEVAEGLSPSEFFGVGPMAALYLPDLLRTTRTDVAVLDPKLAKPQHEDERELAT